MNDQRNTSHGVGASWNETTTNTQQVDAADEQHVDECVVPDGITIQTELMELRNARDEARQAREEAQGKFVNKEERLTVLEAVERDYPTTKKAFDNAYPQLLRAHDNFTDYLDCEESKLITRLGSAAVTEVKRLVKDRNDKSHQLEQAVVDAKNKLQESTAPLEVYNEAIKNRTAELKGWKDLTATVTAQHADLEKFRGEITKARHDGDYGLALGLLLMAKSKREEHTSGPRLVKPSEVHREFHLAGEELAKAQRELAAAQRDLETRKAVLAAVTKDLDEHRKTSEARLRVDLVEIKPAVDDASSAGTGAGASAADAGESPTGGGGPSGDNGGPSADTDDTAADDDMTGGNGHA